VLENLTGHGVGQLVHEAPHIYNYPHSQMKKISFKPNMVVALEPITALNSTTSVEKPANHRNLYTQLGDIGAQWEYTVLVTNKGYEVLAGIEEDLW
jgi:methionyl aminopeptidase